MIRLHFHHMHLKRVLSAVLWISFCSFLSVFLSHLPPEEEKKIMIGLSSTFVLIPSMDFPSRYPQVIIWSQSVGLDSIQYVLTLWSLPPLFYSSFLPLHRLLLPLLLRFPEYLPFSDLMKEFNYSRERNRKREQHSEGRRQSDNERSVNLRADEVKITMVKLDSVRLKERGILNLVGTLAKAVQT